MAGRKFKRPYRAKRKKPFFFKAPFWFSLILIAAFGGGVSFQKNPAMSALATTASFQ